MYIITEQAYIFIPKRTTYNTQSIVDHFFKLRDTEMDIN